MEVKKKRKVLSLAELLMLVGAFGLIVFFGQLINRDLRTCIAGIEPILVQEINPEVSVEPRLSDAFIRASCRLQLIADRVVNNSTTNYSDLRQAQEIYLAAGRAIGNRNTVKMTIPSDYELRLWVEITRAASRPPTQISDLEEAGCFAPPEVTVLPCYRFDAPEQGYSIFVDYDGWVITQKYGHFDILRACENFELSDRNNISRLIELCPIQFIYLPAEASDTGKDLFLYNFGLIAAPEPPRASV